MPNTIPLWSAVKTSRGTGLVVGYVKKHGEIKKYVVAFELHFSETIPVEIPVVYAGKNIREIL
jgi:hypothetical protein